MAFPTATDMLAVALAEAQRIARQIKTQATQIRDKAAAGPIDGNELLNTLDYLRNQHDRLGEIAAVPGIGAYSLEQLGADVTADFAAMRSAIQATRAWLANNLPKDGDDYLLLVSLDGNGEQVIREFPPGATAGFRTQLDALLATIE